MLGKDVGCRGQEVGGLQVCGLKVDLGLKQ